MRDKLDILQGTLDLMVLRTLSTLGPLHGYGIARRIEQVSGDHVILNQGTIYISLVRLEQRGWIRSKWGVSENNRRARFYAITKAGEKQLVGRDRELGAAGGDDGTRAGRVKGRTDDGLAPHDLVPARGRWCSKDRLDREFDEELTTHLELLDRRGPPPRPVADADARREALRKLGRPVALREVHREQRGLPVVDVLAQDLRYAVRMLWKTPAFTAIVTLSLALGIGANTALFSLVDDLLLRSLPVREPDRLVQVQQTLSGPADSRRPAVAFPSAVVRLRPRAQSGVVRGRRLQAPGSPRRSAIDGAVEPRREVEQVSDELLPRSGRRRRSSAGRRSRRMTPSRSSATAGGARDSAAAPTVLGRALTVDGQPYTIVGVAPPRFHGLAIEQSADLWIVVAARRHRSR